MPPLVRISDLDLYIRCPRLVYFEAMGRTPWLQSKSPSNLILREIALSLSDFDSDSEQESDPKTGLENLETWLGEALARAAEELPTIYRDEIDPEALHAACGEVGAIIPQMAKGLAPWLGLIAPSEVEVELRSDRLGLSGRLDRLVAIDGPIPSLIRTGNPPERGVWRGDRIRLTGYALLLEDVHDCGVKRGLVEYPFAGEIREVDIRSVDRRRVLRIRDRVRQIKDGRLPDRPSGAPCERCSLVETCETRRTLASRFF